MKARFYTCVTVLELLFSFRLLAVYFSLFSEETLSEVCEPQRFVF